MKLKNTIMKTSIKQRRQKVGTSYMASGYGRDINKRDVWLIDGKCYAYHKEYANQEFKPLTGEFEGYIAVNYYRSFGTFGALGTLEEHKLFINSLNGEE